MVTDRSLNTIDLTCVYVMGEGKRVRVTREVMRTRPVAATDGDKDLKGGRRHVVHLRYVIPVPTSPYSTPFILLSHYILYTTTIIIIIIII